MQEEVNEILKCVTIDGLIVRLPDRQLDRKLYEKVAAKLILIGGKWTSGKTQGFVFKTDPKELIYAVLNEGAVNIKKEYQFFATPAVLADRLVELAEIGESSLILEPSAGQGAIIEAVRRVLTNKEVCYCEIMETNLIMLKKLKNIRCIAKDFTNLTAKDHGNHFNRIIANPPFSKNQDIEHVKKMYDLLSEDGILVSVMSKHWIGSSGAKETLFYNWFGNLQVEGKANLIEVEAGEFKSSGTNIETVIVKIRK